MIYLKKFNNNDSCYSYVDSLKASSPYLVGYIYPDNKVKYGITEKIFSFKYFSNNFGGFVSKIFNMIPPEELNVYALNRIEDDLENNSKFNMIFKKQNYIKAGIPYYIKLKDESLRAKNNKYYFKVYKGEVDSNNILINSDLFGSIYDFTSIDFATYYTLYNDTLYISQGGTFTEDQKNKLFDYNVFFRMKYNNKNFKSIKTED